MSTWGEIDRTRSGVPVDIVIGNENDHHLIIRLLCRSHPGYADYWDGNWIDSKVRVAAGPVRGDCDASLRSDELENFHRQLVGLSSGSEGKAHFGNMDGHLGLELKHDGKDRLALRGWAAAERHESSLDFEFHLSSEHLTQLIQDLERGLAIFPVLGR